MDIAGYANVLGENVYPSTVCEIVGILQTSIGQVLWSGTWNSGSINVPDSSKYRMFILDPIASATAIVACKLGSNVRGLGGWPNGNGHAIYGFSATIAGDTWTMDKCQSMVHLDNNDHGSLNNNGIEAIYGIVQISIDHVRSVILSGGCSFDYVGGTVVVHVYNCTANRDSSRMIGTLPEGYRPKYPIEGSSDLGAIGIVSNVKVTKFIRVYLDGRVVLDAHDDNSRNFTGQVVFAVQISIAREEYGEVRITPVAGEVVSQYVAFEQPFNEKPFVTLNPQTSTPNNVRVNAGTISNTGFYIYAWRNTDTNITASWMAKGFQFSIDQLIYYYVEDGPWSTGQTKTVPNSSAYNVFIAFAEGGATPMFGHRIPASSGGDIVRLTGNYVNDSNVHTTYAAAFQVSSESWKYVNGSYMAHNPKGNHGAATTFKIGRLYGLI